MHLSRRRAGRLLLGATVVAATALVVPSTASAAGTTGATQTYVVLFKGTSSPANAGTLVTRAGGSVVADYSQIGVLIARSDNTAFGQNMSANNSVEGATATTDYGTQLSDVQAAGPPEGDLPNAAASDADTFSGLQWDMRQIHTPEAHAITGGSPAVLVGDIDTGIDFNHPDPPCHGRSPMPAW